MKITETGILFPSDPASERPILTFPTSVALLNGTLLATVRSGSTKDSEDETVELYRSLNGGKTWNELGRFAAGTVNGVHGTLKICYLTELAQGHLLAASMWVDRQAFPGKPLFNPETEGCLPMAILLADSYDDGETWTPWRVIEMPDDIGPPSLTNPILKLADGTLAMSIETNKEYDDSSKWYQRVVFFHSRDEGQTWHGPTPVAADASGRIFNWDMRCGVAADGRIGVFIWTYDSQAHTYLNIHRRISHDHGLTWSPAEDLGFTDQAGHPAILPDGRVVLPWVDRFKTHTIRARLAADVEAAFDPSSEVVLYSLAGGASQNAEGDTTGALLADMSIWTFGLPYAEVLPDGDVLVVYYAGSDRAMDIHWARLKISDE